jgi:hypothetical protein
VSGLSERLDDSELELSQTGIWCLGWSSFIKSSTFTSLTGWSVVTSGPMKINWEKWTKFSFFILLLLFV